MVDSLNHIGKKLFILFLAINFIKCCQIELDRSSKNNLSNLDKIIVKYVDRTLSIDSYKIFDGLSIEKNNDTSKKNSRSDEKCQFKARSFSTVQDYVKKKFEDYAKNHVLAFKIPTSPRFFFKFATGKSAGSFLTGFGLGFLAFGLKKLLLPLFIGAQIIKSILIAMFLPSILGSLGKLAGKGLSQLSAVSGSSGHQHTQIDDFDFKDTTAYTNIDGESTNNAGGDAQEYNYPDPQTAATESKKEAMNRFGTGGYKRISMTNPHSDNYYIRQPNKRTDYKVFHKIPSSSLLLTSYDPFYSPLLSRLDAVFQQLGLGTGKGPNIEKCRERLVCLMYANPAKYAPYSNLVSAQLSRELNELRKPSSDNPEILRFFKYMKAAKDGQDDEECLAYTGCPTLQATKPSPAMLTTYNDINKLVQARKL